MKGVITKEGVLSVLREVEARRVTGTLRFFHDGGAGEVVLSVGSLAMDDESIDHPEDPVEILLALRSGSYEVWQQLPTLPISGGDATRRHGSLEVHVAADLMSYCERAGLTGRLTLSSHDRVAEIHYDRGDLLLIRFDGEEEDDLNEVFGWTEGEFVIDTAVVEMAVTADTIEDYIVAEQPTHQVEGGVHDGSALLKVVEVALSSILEGREKHRPAHKSSPPMPKSPSVHPSSPPPAHAKSADEANAVLEAGQSSGQLREPTVKIILAGRPDRVQDSTPSSKARLRDQTQPFEKESRMAGEEKIVEDLQAPKAKSPTPAAPHADEPVAHAAHSVVEDLPWVAAVFGVFIVALLVLSLIGPVK